MLLKKDIVDRLAERGYTKTLSNYIVDDFVMVLAEAMVRGESVMLHGFGTFDAREVAPRYAVDVTTGKQKVIPGYRHPRFVPGKSLKRYVKAGKFPEDEQIKW